jgi:hypothetical protein
VIAAETVVDKYAGTIVAARVSAWLVTVIE